nr:gastrin isoform X1 [Microcebus murinus]
MQRLCVYVLIFALALAAFSEASWKAHPRHPGFLPGAPSAPVANRDLEQHWRDQPSAASQHRRQLGPQGPPHLVAGRSCSLPSLLDSPSQVWPRSPRLALTSVPIRTSLTSSDLSKKQGPWLEEEEEAYGWMDFGRRSAEEGDQRP